MSTIGTGETSRPVLTRISVSTAKYSTPTNPSAAGPSSRRTVRYATPIKESESSKEDEPPPSKTVLSRSLNGTGNGRPIAKESERHKRKRESSVASTSSTTSLPKITTLRETSLRPPARPRKKRKLAFTPSDDEDSQEEAPSIKRVKTNGGSAGAVSIQQVLAFTPSDDEDSQEEVPSIKRVKINGGSTAVSKNIQVVASEEDDEETIAKPVLSGNTKSKSRLDPEPGSANRGNRLMEVNKLFYAPLLICN